MNAREFVDSLFEGYEQTTELADFKEELLSNLNAKVDSLVKKGMDTESAFAKASVELGDVSALADELSLKKRKEVFEEVYMDIRKYMNTKRVAAYVIFGALALFGVVAALITHFAFGVHSEANIVFTLTNFFGVSFPFFLTAIPGFVFLGCTQETASAYPMSNKRAAWYTAAALLLALGIFTMPLVYFSTRLEGSDYGVMSTIAIFIPFVLPGAGLLTFLVLTDKDRLKPWAKESHDKAVQREMEIWNDPATASRFGMFSGAIWIFAVALFLLFGFLAGFKFSWLVFLFATAVQLLVQGLMSKQGNK